MADEDISVLLDEKRVFNPKEEFVNQTHVKQWMDKHGIKDLDELYKNAEQWLFYEDYDLELDGWSSHDICSFHVVSEAFQVDIEKARFDIQCMRDNVCAGKDVYNGMVRTTKPGGEGIIFDQRGCPSGHVDNRVFNRLVEKWRRREE